MLNKISHEERVQLTQTMLDVIHIIGEIEDEDVKQTLCENLIGMCDQLKSRLIINMIKEKKGDGGEIMTGPSSEV